jgi:ferrochelatase
MTKGVALLNFGGPQAADEVEPFLFNLFNDRDVIRLPVGAALQRRFASRISRRRAPEIIEQYAAIGGGSPLVPVTMAQADALRDELARRLADDAPPVAVGMRYTAPFADATVAELQASGVSEVIALALYPHYSIATTGSSFNDLARALDRAGMTEVPVTWIPGWFHHPRYLRALADRIREGLLRLAGGPPVHLLFSAHGLPSSYVRKGDPYQMQVQATVREALREVGWTGPYSLSWQSRVGPVRWLAPSTDDELRRLGEAGVHALLVVPVSFVGDHIETLYEIGVTYRAVALAAGIERFEVTRGLDTHPELIGCLADLVEQAVRDGDRRPCIRCLLPREDTYHYARVCPDCHFRKPAFLVREQERRERVVNAQLPR